MLSTDRIQPYPQNPFYWQYKGVPVLLLGGSVEDNLFQITDIEAHLDLLQSVGGNYVRCTMSSRDDGNAWPFKRDPDTGLYDLEKPGQNYWDRFDYARETWQNSPYNPINNQNYNAEESGLATSIDSHPGQRESAFFRTVPTLENNELILR
jgi:hypothetical protein